MKDERGMINESNTGHLSFITQHSALIIAYILSILSAFILSILFISSAQGA